MVGRLFVLLSVMAFSILAQAADWPHWGGDDGRNMVSTATGLPVSFDPSAAGKRDGPATQPGNLLWTARMGGNTYGNPTVSGGKVFVGTNLSRDPRYKGDRGVVLCLDEKTGKLLWQLAVPKLRHAGNFNGDCGGLGICSSPAVEGNRVYVVTNRCDVLCLDTEGQANGNDDPFTDEAAYMGPQIVDKTGTPPRQPKTKPASGPASASRPGSEPDTRRGKANRPADTGPTTLPTLGPTDADIIWRFDMMGELDVWPQDATNCSILIHGDYLYLCTSNGVDSGHKDLGSPNAPSFILLDKKTGKLMAVDDAGIHKVYHGQWSNPSTGKVGGKTLIFWGGGDGFCYAFDAQPAFEPGQKVGKLRVVWKFQCNPPEHLMADGKPFKYRDPKGPSEIIGTPVFHDGKVYVGVGQDPTHKPGVGAFCCIDASAGTGDISAAGKVWFYTDMQRTLSTAAVADGLVYFGDLAGDIHCLDAATGKRVWVQSTGSPIWGSALVADGKVYIGNDKGLLTVLAAGREKKVLSEVHLGAGMYCTPIVANGVMYVASRNQLFAVKCQPPGGN